MSDQITTPHALYGIAPASSPTVAASASSLSLAADVISFLFLLLFQCGAVVTIALQAPQIGEMGLVIFGIIFVWLGTTLIVGVCDLWARAQHS